MSNYLNPYGGSTRWLRGNLHGHTCCGRFMDLGESGRMYASLGYDFVAVTDHNKTCDPAQARGWEQAAGLIVVPGEENGVMDHIIELGVHQVTPTSNKVFADRSAALREAGGFIMACHPQEYANGDQNIRDGARSLHAIEIYNGLRELRGTDESRNVTLWDELLTRGERLWGAATDDFHCQYVTPGHGWVCVQAPEGEEALSWQSIVAQLKRGAFYASTGPTFKRLALDGGQLHIEADKLVKQVCIIGPGGRTLAEAKRPAFSWPVPSGLTYFRVEADCGAKRAWSQPFFPA